jgi:5-keto-L-gluconate epimerase
MKIGLAVAGAAAPPSAFVVFRDDLCRCVDRCADLGFHGVELALLHATEVDVPEMKRRLSARGMEIPCISTGQVFASDQLYFTHPDESVRDAALVRIIEMIRLAAEFGSKVNTGRVRGMIHAGENLTLARQRCLEALNRCADVAEPLGVELIVEPVNRYEINFINDCSDGLTLVEESGRDCVKLMPDLFHMNIEDVSIRDVFERGRKYITYVHVADTNRLAPGWGHMPFDEVFQIFRDTGYDEYITAEILPQPDPESAARQAAQYLLNRLRAGSSLLSKVAESAPIILPRVPAVPGARVDPT